MQNRLPILSVGAVGAGALAGSVLGVVGSWLYLIVLWPVAAAIAAGMATRSLVGVLDVHEPGVARAVGAVAGLVAFGALLVVTFQLEAAALVTDLAGAGGLGDATLARIREERLLEATGEVAHWLRPLGLRLFSGTEIITDVRLDLGAGFNAFVVVGEAVACAWLTARLAARRASEPWCHDCGHWHSRRMIGSAPLSSRGSLLAEMESKRWHRLGRRLARARSDTRDGAILHGWFCDTCDSGAVRFELEVTEPGRRARVIKTVDAPHEALDAILDSQALVSASRT